MTRLGELAIAATPGPYAAGWSGDPEAQGKDDAAPLSVIAMNRGFIAEVMRPAPSNHASTWAQVECDLSYLAGCDPDRVGRLLAVLNAARDLYAERLDAHSGLEQRLFAALDACDADPLLVDQAAS